MFILYGSDGPRIDRSLDYFLALFLTQEPAAQLAKPCLPGFRGFCSSILGRLLESLFLSLFSYCSTFRNGLFNVDIGSMYVLRKTCKSLCQNGKRTSLYSFLHRGVCRDRNECRQNLSIGQGIL